MGMFTVIPENTFESLQLDAGVLLTSFDPTSLAPPADSAIVCATTGGIQVSCVPTYSDLGEDVDNCPVNMKELKHLDSWECKMSFSALSTSVEGIKLALGAADVSGTKVTPRKDLKQADFTDLWWVGDRADGGAVAVQIKNALSTGGFSIQTTKSGKGQTAVELTGHVSIDDQSTMPMVFYSIGPETGSIQLNKHAVTVTEGDTVALEVVTSPASQPVTWGSLDSTQATVSASGSSPYHAATVTTLADGTATITATITVNGVDIVDTCVVTIEASS